MKAIGIVVALLLIALGVGTFVVTREPSRELDAQGRTWVANFSTWHNDISQPLSSAVATTGGSAEEGLSALQVERLSACTDSLSQLGSQPGVLDAVAEEANAACGEIEFALSTDAKYGSSARATTWDHLSQAESLLAVAETILRDVESASDS